MTRKKVQTLILLISFLLSSCKQLQSGNQLKSDEASRRDCSQVLTRATDKALVEQISRVKDDYFEGRLSLEQQNNELQKIVAGNGGDTGPGGLAVTMVKEAAAASLVLRTALNFDEEFGVPPAIRYKLRGLGVASSLASSYVKMMVERIQSPKNALLKAGAVYTSKDGWSLRQVNLSVTSLKADAKLRTAVAYFFSAEILTQLENQKRQDAIFTNTEAFLPPDATGKIGVVSRSEWNEKVERWLASFSRESETFVRATRHANTYGNLTKGRLVEILGGERGVQGKTAPEIEAAGAYKIITSSINQLLSLGVGPLLQKQLRDTQKILLNLEGEAIQEGLTKLDMAKKAAIAAPFIPVAIFAAPYAGSLLGPSWAPMIAKAATTAAFLPLAFSIGSVGLTTSLHLASGNSDYACESYEHFVSNASGGLQSAAFAAWIPVAAATASGGAVASGVAANSVATYGYINLGLVAHSLYGMVSTGVSGAKQCLDQVKTLENAKSNSLSVVDAQTAEALEACLKAGVDLGFAITKTVIFSKEAYTALKSGTSISSEGKGCGLGLADPCGKEEGKAGEVKPGPVEDLRVYYAKLPKATKKQTEAFVFYCDEGFEEINLALRNGTVTRTPEIKAAIKHMDEGINKWKPLPQGLELYRGETYDPSNPLPKKGDVVESKAYVSTSMLQDVAANFTGTIDGNLPTFKVIAVPKDNKVRGAFMPAVEGIRWDKEEEFLLPRGTRMRVTDVRVEQRGKREELHNVVYMELVDAPDSLSAKAQ